MKIDSVGGSMFRSPSSTQQSDAVVRNLRNRIADKQKELQELGADKNMDSQEKLKKSQEIQKEIARLNQELRQYQTNRKQEQREAASEEKTDSRDEQRFNDYMPVDIRL